MLSITPGQIDIHDRERILAFILSETKKQIAALSDLSPNISSQQLNLFGDEVNFKLSTENDMTLTAFLSSRSRWIIEKFNENEWPQGFVVSLNIDYIAHVNIDYVTL